MLKSNALSSSNENARPRDWGAVAAAASPAAAASARDEPVYQSKLGDMIWLELQAWFAGRSLVDQDAYITRIRESVSDTIREILLFEFRTGGERRLSRDLRQTLSSDPSTADIFYDAEESPTAELAASLTGLRLDSGATLIDPDDIAADMAKMFASDDLRSSLDVFNRERTIVMNQALEQVRIHALRSALTNRE